MNRSRLLMFAQLTRLPNVFTAFADIALASVAGASLMSEVPPVFWASAVKLALCSGCLYLAGMVWNDVFDRSEDAIARPFRPIPSGRVRVNTAILIGLVLVIAGLAFAIWAGSTAEHDWNATPLAVAIAITVAVLAYDSWLKHTPAGPLAMASCRFLNVMLGLSLIPDEAMEYTLRLQLAGVVGIYIVGVTWFARTEEGRSNPRYLRLAATVITLSLILAMVLKSNLDARPGTWIFPYLLVGFGFVIGLPITKAVANPGPREVQAAIKRCVLGLIALDAVLATAFIGIPGLTILLLLPPALLIGKWVYST